MSPHLMEECGMSRKKHKAEDIVAKLRQVDVLTAQGRPVAEAVRSIGVMEVTYYRWRPEYDGLKGDQVKRLKELEAENNLPATAPLLNPLCAYTSMASTIRATEILFGIQIASIIRSRNGHHRVKASPQNTGKPRHLGGVFLPTTNGSPD
jgi:hypothetical protein